MAGLNLDVASTQPTQGLSLDTGTTQAPVSSSAAETKAALAHFGMSSTLDLSAAEMYQTIASGGEQGLRNQAAATIDQNRYRQQRTAITQAGASGDTKALQALVAPMKPTNPNSVFEQGFGDTWINTLQQASDNLGGTPFGQAQQAMPDYVRAMAGIGSEEIAKHNMVGNSLLDLNDEVQNEGWFSKAVNWGKSLATLGFYDEYKLRGNVPGVGNLNLLGNNLNAQARALRAEPMEQFQSDYPKIINYLKNSDPSLAVQFASAVQGMSDEAIGQADIGEVSQFLPLPAFKFLRGGTDTAIRQMAKGAFKTSFPTEGIIPNNRALVVTNNMPTEFALNVAGRGMPVRAAAWAAAGDIKSAAMEKVANDIQQDLQGRLNPTMVALDNLTTNFRLDQAALADNTGNMAREQISRLQDAYGSSIERLVDRVTNTMRTMRVNLETASKATITAIQDDLKRKYPGIANRVADITDPIYEPVSNTWHMGMNIIDTDGQLFSSERKAQIAANMQDLKDVEIRQSGVGYYIRIYRPLDENSDPMKSLLTETGLDKSPGGWINAALGWFRSPEDTMSKTETSNRRAATYPVARLRDMVEDDVKYINDLSQGNIKYDPVTGDKIPYLARKYRSWAKPMTNRQGWKEWQRVVAATRDLRDDQNLPGRTFKTVGEWEDFFLRTTQRMPTIQETEAYFAKNRLDLYDHALRNMAMYTNKATHGAETVQLLGVGANDLTRSPKFDAIRMPHMPGGDFGIWVADESGSAGNFYKSASDMSANIGSEGYKQIEEGIKTGKYKAFEIWAPEHRPLQGWGTVRDQRIRYVVTKNVETSPLTWEQVPRRGAGHFDYDYEHYVKQAKIRRSGGDSWYEGDHTIMPVAIRKMGQDIADKLNTVRTLLRDGKEAEAQAFAEDKLPMKWPDLRGWFLQDGNVPPLLDLHEPIMVVPKDTYIANLNSDLAARYKNFRNGLKEGSKNMNFQVHYTGERDSQGLFTFKDVGTRNNPIYQMEPAEMVDPVTALNKGLNRIMHTTFMDDYKRYAISHWLEEAKPWMKYDVLQTYRSNPFWHFSNPEQVFVPGMPNEVRRNMMTNWQKIQQFVGQPSAFDSYLHAVEQKLMDVAYDKLGPKSANVPIWMVGKIKDPVQFVRKMAYHAYLGLFNPAQWLVQNQTWSNIYAISPRSAPAGSIASLLHRWARFNKNPEILDSLDNYASKMGWKPGEWLEAMQTLEKTGFEHVEGEYASLDTPMDYKFIRNSTNNFLDLGQMFFKDGVRNVRIGAWYTAFKEFRREHPTGKLSNTDVQEILNRADRYHANMSRASSSLLNRGVFSLPFQFLTYQMRLAELFLGKRLGETKGERMAARARLVGFYSALYGMPMSVGLSGLPLGNYFRQAAQDNGYVVGDNWYSTMANEGLLSMGLHAITGNYYDVGDRFGAHGFEPLSQVYRMLSGDQTFQEVSGAGANLALPTMNAFGHLMWAMLNQSGYQVTASDWVDIAKQVTSFRSAWKFFVAAKYGEWLSKNEGLEATDVSAANAAFMAFTGLQPQSVSDIWNKTEVIKGRQEADKYFSKRFLEEISRGLRAAKDNNTDLANTFFKNASIWLNLVTETRRLSLIRQAKSSGQSIADKVDWDFYIRTVPPGQSQDYLRAYQRQYQLQHQGNP